MTPGTQIAYIPTHAGGNLKHPDVEFGFVQRQGHGPYHFCRYWRKGNLGQLRTVANAEATPNENLRVHNSVPQELVNRLMVTIESGGDPSA